MATHAEPTTSTPARDLRPYPTDFRTWKILAWTGPVFLFAVFALWGFVARNMPPFPGFPGFPPAEMLDRMWGMMRLTPFGSAFPGAEPGVAQAFGPSLSMMSDMMTPLTTKNTSTPARPTSKIEPPHCVA